MIIQISFYKGEDMRFKYFNTLKETKIWIEKYLDVNSSDFEHLELSFWKGKDEERVRKQIGELK